MASTSTISVKLEGKWKETAIALAIAPAKIKVVWRKTARRHAGILRDKIRKKYKTAKPPLAKSTLLARKKSGRGGRKPLFVSGDLRGSVSVTRKVQDFFVGILRKKSGPFGSLVNLAELHENGKTFAVPATKKSKAFLAGLFGVHGINKSKSDFFIVKIPARKVFEPAFKSFSVSDYTKDLRSNMNALFNLTNPKGST